VEQIPAILLGLLADELIDTAKAKLSPPGEREPQQDCGFPDLEDLADFIENERAAWDEGCDCE